MDFVQTENDKAAEVRLRNRDVSFEAVSSIPPRQPKAPLTLDEAYARYKENRGVGRADLFALMITAIKEMQARIGNVDEAAVAVLDNRVSSMETTIGNALMRVNPVPSSPSMGLAAGALKDRESPTPSGEPITKRGPGRPKKDAE